MEQSSANYSPPATRRTPLPMSNPRSHRRPSDDSSSVDFSASETHERKRRRLSDTIQAIASENEPIESIDLTEVEGSAALEKALAKQREDAVRAQESMHQGKARSVLTSYKCPVCMDTPVDATSTVCGHLFCHKCINDTLKFSEEQRADTTGKGPRGTCPVCRKPLARIDTAGPRRNLIPLKLKLTTTKRRNPVGTEGV